MCFKVCVENPLMCMEMSRRLEQYILFKMNYAFNNCLAYHFINHTVVCGLSQVMIVD